MFVELDMHGAHVKGSDMNAKIQIWESLKSVQLRTHVSQRLDRLFMQPARWCSG